VQAKSASTPLLVSGDGDGVVDRVAVDDHDLVDAPRQASEDVRQVRRFVERRDDDADRRRLGAEPTGAHVVRGPGVGAIDGELFDIHGLSLHGR